MGDSNAWIAINHRGFFRCMERCSLFSRYYIVARIENDDISSFHADHARRWRRTVNDIAVSCRLRLVSWKSEGHQKKWMTNKRIRSGSTKNDFRLR